jgi:aminoglycoside/choline kinase family phosphotransferase
MRHMKPAEPAEATDPTTIPDRLVDSTDELTPEWLTATLRANAVINEHAAVATAHSAVIGTGQLGFVARTMLTYSAGTGPSSVIAKLPSTDPGSRAMGAAMGVYEAEVRFYRDIAPSIRARVPALYAAGLDRASGRFTLLLEDLSSTMDAGDMVRGGTPDQAALAIAELVPLQAPVWNAPAVTRPAWLGVDRTQMLFDHVEQSVEPFLQRFGERIGDDHIRLIERLAPKAGTVTGLVWQSPFVVCHGDYRLDNMMFGRHDTASPIAVIDWQGARIGPPLLDAAIYLSSCLPPEQRRAVERDLLREYHTRLVAAGVCGFDLEDCWRSYRASSLYPFLLSIAVSVTIARTERGDDMWTRMFLGAADLVTMTEADHLLG